MHKSRFALTLALFSLALTACTSPAEQRLAALQIGWRQLADDDFWDPLDRQQALSLELALLDETGVGGEVGISHSSDDLTVVVNGTPVKVEASVTELYGGVRKAWPEHDHFQPYLAAGISLAKAEVEASFPGFSHSEDDNTFGLYIRGGVDFFLGESFFAGLDLRYLMLTDIEMASFIPTDVDGLLVGVRLGVSF
jgi:opacity protein-like surface antigen